VKQNELLPLTSLKRFPQVSVLPTLNHEWKLQRIIARFRVTYIVYSPPLHNFCHGFSIYSIKIMEQME
jgi:hypothetical protein